MSEITEAEIKAMSKEENYMRGYTDGTCDTLGIRVTKLTAIRRCRCNSWDDLRNKAAFYSNIGFICRVNGWQDMRNNILTLYEDDLMEGKTNEENGNM